MDFIAKREVFHNGKLRQEGETVVSGEKLDTIYPKLFVKKGGRQVTQEQVNAAPKSNEPERA